jgi:hypothetical protein
MGILSKIRKKLSLAPSNGLEGQVEDLNTEQTFRSVYDGCKPFTMTSLERMYSLYNAVEYLVKNNIDGDFVECGVWKGGSSMVMTRTLLLNGITDRNIYLYDTFEGMSEPKAEDKDLRGNPASTLLNKRNKDEAGSIWCYSSLEEVKANLGKTGYPPNRINYVAGKVEDTIPGTIPAGIALLRLDTDWYDSTYHELVHLYPLLCSGGILIIDDYGHWQGARKAVDNYFKELNINPLLHRIDYTGRILQKR